MSGSTAKELRRDLRRAMGEDAVEIINQHTKVIDNRILPNIGALQQLCDDHEGRIRALEGRIGSLSTKLRDFRGMTLRQRLRWLIIGR